MSVNDDMNDPNKVLIYLVVGGLILGLLGYAASSGGSTSSGANYPDSGQNVYTPRGDW